MLKLSRTFWVILVDELKEILSQILMQIKKSDFKFLKFLLEEEL